MTLRKSAPYIVVAVSVLLGAAVWLLVSSPNMDALPATVAAVVAAAAIGARAASDNSSTRKKMDELVAEAEVTDAYSDEISAAAEQQQLVDDTSVSELVNEENERL